MIWVPVLERVSVSAFPDSEPGKLRERGRIITEHAAIAVIYTWKQVDIPHHTIIPGQCATVMHADNAHQYSIVGWKP